MGGKGSGKPPRAYPPEVIDLAVSMYESGSTIREVQAALPPGYKAQRILERFMDSRRPAVKRDQRGDRNPQWKGAEAGYQAFHLRVKSSRGNPSHCERCFRSVIAGQMRMCQSCHRRFDNARRKGVLPNV